MSIDFLKTEYGEVSNSLRHLNDIRLRMVQFCITINGLCLVFYANFSTSTEYGLWHTLFSKGGQPEPYLTSNLMSPKTLITLLAISVTLLSLAIEVLSAKQFGILSKRGRDIEMEFSIKGQYHISLSMQEGRKGMSALATGIIFYLVIVGFWILTFLV